MEEVALELRFEPRGGLEEAKAAGQGEGTCVFFLYQLHSGYL
jgi:hypothetical protein